MKFSEMLQTALSNYGEDDFMCCVIEDLFFLESQVSEVLELKRIIKENQNKHTTLASYLRQENPQYLIECENANSEHITSMSAMRYKPCYEIRCDHWRKLIVKLKEQEE